VPNAAWARPKSAGTGAPEPAAQRRLRAGGVALTQHRQPAVEAREIGARVRRIRRDDAVDHLAAGREIAGLERELRGEEQRVGRARSSGLARTASSSSRRASLCAPA